MPTGERATLSLAEDTFGPAVPALWISWLVALGTTAARWSQRHPERRLVVAVSVPARDFAAVLIGCGWMRGAPENRLPEVRQTVASLARDTDVRMITPDKIVTRTFLGFDAKLDRLMLKGTQWMLPWVQAIAPIEAVNEQCEQPIPKPGVFSRTSRFGARWIDHLCRPPSDLALVGTLAWLRADLDAYICWDGEREQVSNILLPERPKAATWSTRLVATARVGDELQLPPGIRAAVLDGAAATRWIGAIEAPVVVAVLDRSVIDESADEVAMEYRANRGKKTLDLHRDFGLLSPPAGIEALAFTVTP
ncbi:hypothetical protein [Pseudofrankia inefficax]|nr:hypothetical protein [Pseudofrankia inefficax]